MTRKLSIAILFLQCLLFASILNFSAIVEWVEITKPDAEHLFRALGIGVVALAPFGLFSALMSLFFGFCRKTGFLGGLLEERASMRTPEMFFVWKEYREDLQ